MSETEILHVKNVSKYFGGLAAVNNCSLRIKKGSITGIIGPNGSGKTTLFNLIAGNIKSTKGSVIFNNENITNIPSYQLFFKRTFKNISDCSRVFKFNSLRKFNDGTKQSIRGKSYYSINKS